MLGFEVNWLEPDKSIGAVSRVEDFAIFFRKRTPPFEPAVHWIFAPDIDATYDELKLSGANIVEPLERKPWGLRQFTWHAHNKQLQRTVVRRDNAAHRPSEKLRL